jgi:sterol 3beta-glucosyltransferase
VTKVRIVIIATGSRGDVEPYIALGKGLKKAGHYVRLISHQNFQSLVNSHGLEFWGIEGNVQEIAQSTEMSERIAKGNFISVLSQMRKEAEGQAIGAAKTGVNACQGMEIILTGLGGLFFASAFSEQFKIPLIQAYYIPFTPTGAFPSFIFPNLPQWLGSPINRFSYHVMRQIIWQGFRSADRVMRKQVLNLPSASLWGPYKSLSNETPILYGFSPSIIQKAPDWSSKTYVTGFWFLDEPTEWKPPQNLVDFLNDGPAPLYIGFGSMSSKNPEETTNLILSALNATKQRAIMLTGWNGLKKIDLPSSVFMIDSVPFAWLFPKMAAVIHHGGAGTTHYGIRAGVPSIIVPFFADQPFWGKRVKELGVGPEPIPRKKLTVKNLTKAIDMVLEDSAMRHRAAELGERVKQENGIDLALQLISTKEGGKT